MSLVGVEPTRPDKGSLDFKSNASAISPQRHASGEAKVSSEVERDSVADGEGFGKSKLGGGREINVGFSVGTVTIVLASRVVREDCRR